jgi:hypothetical protein
MTPEDSDTSTDLNWFKTYAEQDLADAREYLPSHTVEDLIIEVSEKVMPRGMSDKSCVWRKITSTSYS